MDESNDAALDDRLRFERLIADLSAEFVNLDSDLIDGVIQSVQRRLVEALGLDRSTLFQFSEDGASLTFTHYWSRPDLPPPPLLPRPAELFPWSTAKVLAGDMISFSSIDELPQEYPSSRRRSSLSKTTRASARSERAPCGGTDSLC